MRINAILLASCTLLVHSYRLVAQQVCAPGKALVIGNGAYRNTAASPGSVNDAHSIAEALRALNFQVTEQPDIGIEKLDATVTGFRASLRPTDTAFFYYSGYVVQFQDDNYLVPVDFPARNPNMDAQAYSVSRVKDLLSRASTGPKLLVLDIWRNPDLAARFPATELAPLAPGQQMLIAYPVPSNQVAPGGRAAPSLFTRYLQEALKTPGLGPVQLINHVIVRVSKETSNQQVPGLSSLISSECYLTGPPPASLEKKLQKELEDEKQRAADARKKQAEAENEREREKRLLDEQLRKASELKPGATRANPKDRQEYVWIPPGTFQMGCVPQDSQCEDDEKPRHTVVITKGFWMGQTEVQVASYISYVKMSAKARLKVAMPKSPQTNRRWANTNLPVVNVTADDALSFCQYAGGRLPTEAEWEYAARAGTDLTYPWGNSLTKDVTHAGAKGAVWDSDSMAPVKQFTPNTWGLYDMAGNVWELCSDWYDPEYYSRSPKEEPTGPTSGQQHVKRGGSFNSAEKELRISIRHRAHTYKWPASDNNTGFRCVVDQLP